MISKKMSIFYNSYKSDKEKYDDKWDLKNEQARW